MVSDWFVSFPRTKNDQKERTGSPVWKWSWERGKYSLHLNLSTVFVHLIVNKMRKYYISKVTCKAEHKSARVTSWARLHLWGMRIDGVSSWDPSTELLKSEDGFLPKTTWIHFLWSCCLTRWITPLTLYNFVLTSICNSLYLLYLQGNILWGKCIIGTIVWVVAGLPSLVQENVWTG